MTPFTTPSRKINWLIFFAVLLAPALLTTATASSIQTTNENVSPAIALFGGGAAGIACGIMLGLRFGKTIPVRIALCVLFSLIFVVVCVLLCLLGCTLGNYDWRY